MTQSEKKITKQIYNPFLPLSEYIPDGEPHIFGDRVYIYGSHDREGGHTFCMEDYVTYSASVDDLTDWRYEGVIYRASQDPDYPRRKYMYAPDVVLANDGRYYLYYAMSGEYGQGGYHGPISVAAADSPCGPFTYLGYVRNPDGSPMTKYVCFDPGVMNDDGVIRLYYGTQYGFEEEDDFASNTEYLKSEAEMFGKTEAEILGTPESVMGPSVLVLCDDMLTVKEEAKHIIPYRVKGTSFEEHPFFEAASMRKVGDRYYFIYSSWLNHELCYAVSDKPDEGFVFGGTIVSNGDVGYKGRGADKKLNMTGTTHGSIIKIRDQWYVFYHRLTHKSDYSRQACAEKIYIGKDGSIRQVEITSCGLNYGPLKGQGRYPAVICCNLTNGHMPSGSNSIYKTPFPNVTNIGDERFIAEIEDGTLIGYKYFEFRSLRRIALAARIECESNKPVFDGPVRLDSRCDTVGEIADTIECANDAGEEITETFFTVHTDPEAEEVARIELGAATEWTEYEGCVNIADGIYPLYLIYHGRKKAQLLEVVFI